jgi:hypothetical protein
MDAPLSSEKLKRAFFSQSVQFLFSPLSVRQAVDRFSFYIYAFDTRDVRGVVSLCLFDIRENRLDK